MDADLKDAILGILAFGAMLILGIPLSIMASMQAESLGGPGAGLGVGTAALLACWGTAFVILYKTLRQATQGREPTKERRR